MLLENGALCERDTFQGERCLYNALNDRIRNLLLQYDYSKSTDPLQPLAAHITSLLFRDTPKTGDITIHTSDATFELHKFVLSARSPYFPKEAGCGTGDYNMANECYCAHGELQSMHAVSVPWRCNVRGSGGRGGSRDHSLWYR